jgi:hypothetical protein
MWASEDIGETMDFAVAQAERRWVKRTTQSVDAAYRVCHSV